MERGFRNNLRQMLHSNLNSNQEIGKWEENKQSLQLNLRSKLLNLPASEYVRKRPAYQKIFLLVAGERLVS